MGEMKFGACLPTFGSCADRYCLSGYSESRTLEQMFERASQVKELTGIELIGNWHLNEDNFPYIKGLLDKYDLEVCMMVPDLWTQAKWGRGSFTSKDKAIREDAYKEVIKIMDMAADIGCDKVDLWFGQDGYDYPFQADYVEAWGQLVEYVRRCANYRNDVKVCIEYKLKEPRTHCFINSAAKAMCLINEVGRDNVGILLDMGHATAAQENAAEAAAFIGSQKLYYVHFNDNYGLWDDDMMFGSIHTIEAMEFLYWLDRIGYNGYYTLDIFPYREDGIEAARESFAWIKGLKSLIDELGYDAIAEVIKSGDATKASKMMRKAICRIN